MPTAARAFCPTNLTAPEAGREEAAAAAEVTADAALEAREETELAMLDAAAETDERAEEEADPEEAEPDEAVESEKPSQLCRSTEYPLRLSRHSQTSKATDLIWLLTGARGGSTTGRRGTRRDCSAKASHLAATSHD